MLVLQIAAAVAAALYLFQVFLPQIKALTGQQTSYEQRALELIEERRKRRTEAEEEDYDRQAGADLSR